MNKNLRNAALFDGAKSVPIDRLPEEAWTFLFGGTDVGAENLRDLFEKVPWLFRGVTIRAQAAQRVPFVIMQGEEVVDSSEDYQNKIGWLPDPFELIYLTEGALALHGRSFWFVERNTMRTLRIRWMFPLSVKEKTDKAKGLVGFTRTISGEVKDFDLDDFVYVRTPNLWGELGHGRPPAHAALAAAGVLLSVDEFATAFFERGAIKATLLTTPSDTSERERKRLLGWWRRVFDGVQNAFKTDVVSTEVKAEVIGEGLGELSDQNLTKEKREDISTAMGVPQSILFSSGVSNRSVREQDQLSLYTETIIPDTQLIERTANAQLFLNQGYRLKFQPQQMELFQANEEERSAALVNLTSSGVHVLAAMDILGFDVSDESMQLIVENLQSEQERKERFAERLERPRPVRVENDEKRLKSDLDKWRRKSLNNIKRNGKPLVSFDSEDIPYTLAASIMGQLEEAMNSEDVYMIFEDAENWGAYP